jgi:hypothetical protein
VANLPQYAPAGDQPRKADWHVDQEHPAPAGLDEQSAERRPGGGGDTTHSGPYADRHVPLLCRELGQQQAQRGGQQEGRAKSLHGARRHEEGDRGGGGAGGRGEHEQRDAQQEGALASDCIRPASGGDQKGREDDRVGVEDP